MAHIDLQVFSELQATAGDEFVAELVQSFLEDVPLALTAMRRAAREGEAQELRRQAHSLKSNGLTFGALAFGEQARRLEHTPLAELDDPAAEVEHLAALFDAAAGDLKALCHA